jgi:hypothetical protein
VSGSVGRYSQLWRRSRYALNSVRSDRISHLGQQCWITEARAADDEISGDRLILGLEAGYKEHEFRAFGYPFDHLVGRFEEALQISIRCCATVRLTSRGSTMRHGHAICGPAAPGATVPRSL